MIIYIQVLGKNRFYKKYPSKNNPASNLCRESERGLLRKILFKDIQMTELIRIEEKEGIQTVNARELHEFLEVGRDFSNWIKQRIEKYDFVENQDFAVIAGIGENPNGGRPLKEYHISTEMAKELSMLENNEKGKQARRYFKKNLGGIK